MDRMSVASGSIGSGTTLSGQTRDEFRHLYNHFMNIHQDRDRNRAKAEKEAKNWIRCWKLTSLKSETLIVREVEEQTRGIADRKKAKDKAGKHLWNKLNYLAERGVLIQGVSKSALTNATLDYAMKFAASNRVKEEITLDSSDEEPLPQPTTSSRPPPPPEPGSERSLLNDMFNFFKEKFIHEIPNPESRKRLIEELMKTVTDKVGFMPASLLALYAADELHVRKDPRRSRPPRIEELFRLYFKSYEMLLPAICPLDKLASLLVEYCRRNRMHCGATTPDHIEKYKSACEKIDQLQQQINPRESGSEISISPEYSTSSNRPREERRVFMERSGDRSRRSSSRDRDHNQSRIKREHRSRSREIEHHSERRIKREQRSRSREVEHHSERRIKREQRSRSREVERHSERRRRSASRDHRSSHSQREHQRSRSRDRRPESRRSRSKERDRDMRQPRSPPRSYQPRSPERVVSRRRTPPRRESRGRDSPPRSSSRRRSPPRRDSQSRTRDSEQRSSSRRSQDRDRRSESRRRSPPRRDSQPSGLLDSKELGFGNTRNMSQEDLKFFKYTRENFQNVMDGIIAFTDNEKDNTEVYNGMNSNKIVLDFLIYLKRANYTLGDIQNKAKDKLKLQKMSSDVFGKGNKTSSPLHFFTELFNKAAFYCSNKFEPSEAPTVNNIDSDLTPEQGQKRVNYFLDTLYGNYIKKRKCSPDYFDLHEAIFFSTHIRRSPFLNIDMEIVANEFIKFLADKDITPSELKKSRLNNMSQGTGLPSNIQNLYKSIQATIHEFYIHEDSATRFCAIVDAVEFDCDDSNGLMGLIEYYGKCILQEIYLLIENKEVERLAFADINRAQLREILNNFSDQLINNCFTIFDAVSSFYQGTMTQYMTNVLHSDDLVDKDLTMKIVHLWVASIVKRRTILGPPLAVRVRDLIQKKAYILIRSYSIVDIDKAKNVQWNKSFPPAIEQEAVKIIQDKSKDVKLEPDQEMMQFLNLDENAYFPILKSVEGHGQEPFIDHPGNVMILEEVKIGGKGRVQVRASLCGVPRIKPLAHMQIWANAMMEADYCCKVTTEDHRLICQNKLVLNLVNISDTEVELPAFTLIAYAQVKEKNENTLRVKPLTPVWLLLFLKHYYETCKMDKIHDHEDEDCFQFMNGHELKIRKSEKINFRITFSEILKPEGELYNVHAVVFFLQNFKGDYKEYLERALAKRVPIIACRDHDNLIKYFNGVIPKCHQMRPRGKLSLMDFNEDDSKDLEMKDVDCDAFKQLQAQHGVDVAELISVIRDQSGINNELAEFRLTNFLKMMSSMNYDLTQFVWDAMKSGKTRDLFESTFSSEVAKYYKDNPNMFQECQILTGTECLQFLLKLLEESQSAKDESSEETKKVDQTFKTLDHAKVSLAFLRLFQSNLNDSQNLARKELDRIIAREARENLTRKRVAEELASLDLVEKLVPIIDIVKSSTEIVEAKHEKLSLYVAADANAMAYLLILPKDEEDPTKGRVIHMGSRLLASCEKQLMLFIKLGRCITFAFTECKEIIGAASMTIFVDEPDVDKLFTNVDHCEYVHGFDFIPKDFITITDGKNPAGLLLLTRPLKVDYMDKIERLYALSDTAKAFLSTMLTKKKKAKYNEKLARLEAQQAMQVIEMEQGENDDDDKDGKDKKKKDIVTNKNNFGRNVIAAWTSSKLLVPYSKLIMFVTESFIVSGDNATYAKNRAIDLASRLSDADITYEKLASCNEDDLLALLKKVKLPRDITEKAFSAVILDHFLPGPKQIDFESSNVDNDEENEQEVTLAEFFRDMEKGAADANKKIVERKKLFVPMRKHFVSCLKQLCSNNPEQTASDMVNAWIATGRKVDELKSVYEKHIFKGSKYITNKYEEWLGTVSCPNILAQWTYNFFVNNSKVYHAKTNLNHNDFRRKHLMKLQSETILRTSYAPLQHFYEILHKFHKKEEEAPQTAMKYIEVWMLLGFHYEDVVAMFMSAVHLPRCFEELLTKLRKIFEDASCFNLKDIDSKVLLEYTGMFFKAKTLLADVFTTSKTEESKMDVDDIDLVDKAHWDEVKSNVLNVVQVTGEDFDNVITEHLHGKYTAANLNKIMRKIPSMCDRQHFSAFKAAFQANLLKDKCDQPSHAILKDALEFLSKANFCPDIMDEDIDDVEDGECITDTGNETDVSSMSKISGKSANKKKGVLSLTNLSNLSHDELKNGTFEETIEELDFKSLRGRIYLVDNEFVWITTKQRFSLQDQVQVGDQTYKLERLLCLCQIPIVAYGDYVKEMRRNFPLVDPLKLQEFEVVSSDFMNGLIKVPLRTLSKEQMLKSYLKKFTKMMKQKSEEPPTFKAVSISYQKLAQKFYKSVFANGLHCQQNWAEVSSSIAEECIDCWLVPNFSFTDLLTAFKRLENDEGEQCIRAKKRVVQSVYDEYIDGLIDHVDSLPPSLKLHYFTRDTMIYLESLVISEEF